MVTAFVDVSPEEAEQKSPYESFKDASGTSSFKDAQIAGVVSIVVELLNELWCLS